LIINALFNALYFHNERAEQLCISVTFDLHLSHRLTVANARGNGYPLYVCVAPDHIGFS